jgi:hypothetical protein
MALGMEQPRSNLIEVLKAERAREKELKRREKLTPEELQTLFAKELVQLEEKSPGFTKLAVRGLGEDSASSITKGHHAGLV